MSSTPGHKPPVDELPEELVLVRSFVNTLDIEALNDAIANRELLAGWLREHGLVPTELDISRRDLALAIEVRDALRRLLLANSGQPLSGDEHERVNAAFGRLSFDLAIAADGAPIVRGRGSPVAAALARIVAGIAQADSRGTWGRMKLCPAEDCLWAFYDHSKNRSRRWCSMDVCGNRTKTRVYRQRHTPRR